MIYADYDGLQNYRINSSRHTPSATKNNHISDSLSGHRHHHHHHHHHHYQQAGGKSETVDQQQLGNGLNEDLEGRKRVKSQEQMIPPNSQMGKKDLIFFISKWKL
jgi:ABC-type nickel/cobalt efflux system permease component RcnA